MRRYRKAAQSKHKMPTILGRMSRVCGEITKTGKGLTEVRDKLERLREVSGAGGTGRGKKKAGKSVLSKALSSRGR